MSGVTFSVAAIWMLLGASPQATVVQDQFDLIEVNHYYDSQGRLVFDQVIFYEWSHSDDRFQVAAWRLMKSSGQFPQKCWHDESYVSQWRDGETLRRVKAHAVRETWTQYDPELLERDYLPREYRRGLTPRNVATRK